MVETVRDHRTILSPYIWNGRAADTGVSTFISYSFETASPWRHVPYEPHGPSYDATFRPLAFNHQEAARTAFQLWDQASGVVFFEVAAGLGDIRLAAFDFDLADPEFRDLAGYAATRHVSATQPAAGTIYIDAETPAASVNLFLHEIGHSLGLKHPHEGETVLAEDLDSTAWTVMSYNATDDVLGPFDTEAIARLYGSHAGDGSHVERWSWDAARYSLMQAGHDGADRLNGIGGYNVIDALGGNDAVKGASAHDVVRGGSGADDIWGFGGNDHLYGHGPNGGADSDDTVRGGDGHDYLQGNAGADDLFGGTGDDRIQGGADADRIMGDDGFDTVNGNRGEDLIDGGDGNDWFRGGQDGDRLFGGQGEDAIFGDLGNDVLDGGSGVDHLWGGEGADVFRFQRLGDDIYAGASIGVASVRGADLVVDYADGVDRLQLDMFVGTIVTGSADNPMAAERLAMTLLRSRSDVAAIAVGEDSYLFVAHIFSHGGAVPLGVLALKDTTPSEVDRGDFIL